MIFLNKKGHQMNKKAKSNKPKYKANTIQTSAHDHDYYLQVINARGHFVCEASSHSMAKRIAAALNKESTA